MDKGDTFDLFLPRERRSGIDRRQFTYDVYIPERRLLSDRRRFETVGMVKDSVARERSPDVINEGEPPELPMKAGVFEQKTRM